MSAQMRLFAAYDRIEKLQAELAAIEASIPRVKHDAILDSVKSTGTGVNGMPPGYLICKSKALEDYARNLLTQDA